MQLLSNMLVRLLFCSLIVSCAYRKSENVLSNWNYPPENPFPTIFTVRAYKDNNIALTASLKPETVKMSCRMRDDSPYYWCDFQADLVSPYLNLPHTVSSTFHRVVNEKGKNAAMGFAKRVRNDNEPLVVVLQTRASISSIDNSIYSQLLGIYNNSECFDTFEDYSLCPSSAKKLDIFSGKYVEE